MKQGQIAHLDRNNTHTSDDNLAFLCLNHHDVYDSRTSQSKNFTIDEVKFYRKELYAALNMAFSAPISFGGASIIPFEPSGYYIRNGEYDSAELVIQRMVNGQYHVEGLALWGKSRKCGPNLGELDFIADLLGDTIQFNEGNYLLVLRFSAKGLIASEEQWIGYFGMNVQFTGEYLQCSESPA